MGDLVLGIDFGTASVRAAVIDTADGRELSSGVYAYRRNVQGNELFAVRQDPADYLEGLEISVLSALDKVDRSRICGIGIDVTGSTIMPVDVHGIPLYASLHTPSSAIWLWKDHSGIKEAETITNIAKEIRPAYLEQVGGVYSAELFWSKVFHCLHAAPEVMEKAASWVELADWLPFVLTGGDDIRKMYRSVCGAAHKALYNPDWGGYPDETFIRSLDERLLKLLDSLDGSMVRDASSPAGLLSSAWMGKFHLSSPVVVSVSAFDAHFGGVGAGVRPGTLVKTIGTSTCDLAVTKNNPVVKGAVGVVRDSIVPGLYGIEAGQSAVGDLFGWYVHDIAPKGMNFQTLDEKAKLLRPGESGLVVLDWFNGNRSPLLDQALSGMIVGLTLDSSPEEIYRSLIEATAFGARKIMERLKESGIAIDRIVVCGGIPRKNPLLLHIYADVLKKDIHLSRNRETCALGGAIAASVVSGLYASFPDAMAAMTAEEPQPVGPDSSSYAVYDELFGLYSELYSAFGSPSWNGSLYEVMKRLLRLKEMRH